MSSKTPTTLQSTESKAQSNSTLYNDEDPEELFDIIQPLGKGAFGTVYKALDKRDGEIVALKIMRMECDNEIGSLDHEVAIMKQCKSPHIVNFRGAWLKEENIWIAMEFCGSGSVLDIMRVLKVTLTEQQIAVITRETLLALQYVHKQKLIHRDIKAANILLNHKGQCKLSDFGVSYICDATMDKAKTILGTPYWMAPEVIKDDLYNSKADLWSLGITIIEMAAGRPPNSEEPPLKVLLKVPTAEPPTLPNEISDMFSEDMKQFIALCLVKEPKKRASASTLLEHIWIKSAKTLRVTQTLVCQALPQLEKSRNAQREMEMDENGWTSSRNDYSTDYKCNEYSNGTMPYSTGTMAYSKGTMAFNTYSTNTMMVMSDGGMANDNTMVMRDENVIAMDELKKKLRQSQRENRLLTDQIEEIQRANETELEAMIRENIELKQSCDTWQRMYENERKLNTDRREGELDAAVLGEIHSIVMEAWNSNESGHIITLNGTGNGSGNESQSMKGNSQQNNSGNSQQNNNGNNSDESDGNNSGNAQNNSGNGNGNGNGNNGRRDRDDKGRKNNKKEQSNEDSDSDSDEEETEEKKENENTKLNVKAQAFVPKNGKAIDFIRQNGGMNGKKYMCILAPISENKSVNQTKHTTKLSKSMKQQMSDNTSEYSYSPNAGLRIKGNIDISKKMTQNKNGIIADRIREEIGNLYFYMDKTAAMTHKHRVTKVYDSDNNGKEERIQIMTFDFHCKDSGHKLYCVVRESETLGKWTMAEQLYTRREIAHKYNVSMMKLIMPRSPRMETQFKAQLGRELRIKAIMAGNMRDLINKCKWTKMGIKNRNFSKKRVILSLNKAQFIKNVNQFNNYSNANNINLFPILMFNNVSNTHWIEYVWIVNIDRDINIGISLQYSTESDSISIKGIHLDKGYILEQIQLVSPQYSKTCLDGVFSSNITDLSIGNCDDQINAIKALKQQNKQLQNENKRLSDLVASYSNTTPSVHSASPSPVSTSSLTMSNHSSNYSNLELSHSQTSLVGSYCSEQNNSSNYSSVSKQSMMTAMAIPINYSCMRLLYQVYIIGDKLIAIYV